MPNVPNNSLVTGAIRSGISRNDGTNGFGTATPSNLMVINYAGGQTTLAGIPVEELEDSPIIERAEQCTATHHYRSSYQNCVTLLGIFGRGTLVTDDSANYYRVLSSSIQYQKGQQCLFTVATESISFDVPPDEFSVMPVKLGLDIMKHPRYFYALMPTNQIQNFTGTADTDDQINAKQVIIRAIQAYRENPFIPTSQNINGMVGLLHETIIQNFVAGNFTFTKTNPNWLAPFITTPPDPIGTMYSGYPYPPVAVKAGDKNPAYYYVAIQTQGPSAYDPGGRVALAMAAAKEIIGKLWRMEDSPMVNGVEVTWTEYYFRPPYLNLGGYIEDPVLATPSFPDYFYSVDYPPSASDTIWDNLGNFNPQCFSITGETGGGVSIAWLRDADVLEYQRTWFRVTRKWLGAPIGAWDADIYGAVLSGGQRPTLPAHYRNLLLS